VLALFPLRGRDMYEAALPFPQFDPVLIHLWGSYGIRWYALSYIAGLLLGWWYVARLIRDKTLWNLPPFNGKPPATPDDIGDFVVWATLGVVLGGRLGWVLFYGTFLCGLSPGAGYCNVSGGEQLPMAFLHQPWRIVAAWEGGMSFHGGLIGVVVALWLFTRRRKLDFLPLGDLVACAAPIGLFFGRIANFINGELWGKPATVPWAIVFCNRRIMETYNGQCPAGIEPRHPSQLYEAGMEGLLLFLILLVCLRRFRLHDRPGLLGAIFLTGYGTFRFIAEIFREPDTQFIGWFSLGMAFSIPMWLGAAYLYWCAFHPTPKSAPGNVKP
jgi:phosphatidylglycerol:prolipoprotein diacylglycerol transferase